MGSLRGWLQKVVGDIAHGSADDGYPIKVGGKAYSAEPTAVDANDRVNAYFDTYGRLHVAVDSMVTNVDLDLEATDLGVAAEAAALGVGVLVQGDDGTDRTNLAVDTDGHVQVDVLSMVANVDLDIEASDLGAHAEDAAHVSGDAGIMALAIRDDTLGASSGTEGDYEPLHTNANGALWVAPVSNSGVDIGDVDILSVLPGTGATNLGKAEDAGHSTGDVGVMALGVRNSSYVTLTSDELDYSPIAVDNKGRLLIAAISGGITPGTASADLGKAEDAAHTTGDTGVAVLAVSAATPTATASAAGDYQPLCVSSVDGALYTRALANGAALTLKASGAQTASTNGTGVVCAQYRRLAILFDVTVADTDATDTLDVYIDVLGPDATTWLNAVHFNQIIGTDAAVKYWAVLDTSNPGTATFNVTTDAAEEAVRPYLFGSQIRYRSVIVDTGSDDASFTYAVTAYGQ